MGDCRGMNRLLREPLRRGRYAVLNGMSYCPRYKGATGRLQKDKQISRRTTEKKSQRFQSSAHDCFIILDRLGDCRKIYNVFEQPLREESYGVFKGHTCFKHCAK